MPCQKVCASEPVQSSSPMSSSMRQVARLRSFSDSHFVVRGKLGSTKKQTSAMATVMAPSTMKSQRQARRPRRPSILAVIPAVIKPENAPLISEPEYSNEVRSASSLRVYQQDRKYRHPG